MGLRQKHKWVLLLVLLNAVFLPAAVSRTGIEGNPPVEDTKTKEPFDSDRWQELSRDFDYTEMPKPVKTIKPRSKAKPARFHKEIVIVAVVVFLTGLILWMYLSLLKKRNAKAPAPSRIIQNHDPDLPKGILGKRYEEALRNEDYRLAVRYFHKLLLYAFSDREIVKLKQDKTNRAYLQEMHSSEWHDPFKEITRLVEAVWFGNRELNRVDFLRIVAPFNSFLSSGR